MAKGETDSVRASKAEEERCELCFCPLGDGNHEGGACAFYDRLKKVLASKGGIIIMA